MVMNDGEAMETTEGQKEMMGATGGEVSCLCKQYGWAFYRALLQPPKSMIAIHRCVGTKLRSNLARAKYRVGNGTVDRPKFASCNSSILSICLFCFMYF